MEIIKLLKKLINISSYVDTNKNEKEIIEFILKILSKNKSLIIKKQKVENGRYNLIVTDNKTVKTILFGHLDTVLPKKENQQPFNSKISNGKIYGLGSVDMKAGIAIILDIAINHHIPGVGYIFSIDEEYNFKGAIELKKINYLHPKTIINLEPTNLKILNGCRGITEFSFTVHGKSAHAGNKLLGVNAIETAVNIVNKLEKELSNFDKHAIGKNSINLSYLHGGVLQKTSNTQKPKISSLGMVVPNFAFVNCEIRIGTKNIDKDFIKKTITKFAKEFKASVSNFKFKFYFSPMLTIKSKSKKFEEAIINNNLKAEYQDINLSGYYEIQMIQEKWGGESIIFGPGPMETAHTSNECCRIADIYKTKEIVLDFLKNIY